MKKLKIKSLKNLSLPKFDKTKIKLDKKTSLIILVGVLFSFLSQFLLGIVMYLVVINFGFHPVLSYLTWEDLLASIAQLLLILASGFIVGWLAKKNSLILGSLTGLAIVILSLGLNFITISQNQTQINPPGNIINLISNGIFIIILVAVGGKAGQVFYFKRHTQNLASDL